VAATDAASHGDRLENGRDERGKIAGAHTESDFIPAEVHGPGVGSLPQSHPPTRACRTCGSASRRGKVLQHMIRIGRRAAAIHLLFPDSVTEEAHHKPAAW